MAIANTKNYSYLMDPTYRKIFFNQYGTFPSHMSECFNIETVSKGNWIAEAMMSPLGAAGIVPEGNAIQFDSPVQGYAVKKYFDKYGLGFQVTEEMQDDDLTPIIQQMPAQLGVGIAYARELAMADLFNNGMTASLYTGMDGKAIFATGHTCLRSPTTTQDNTVASGASLSQTPLQSALDLIYNWKDEAGRLITGYEPQYLMVPVGLRWMAVLLTKNEGKPETTDRDMNVVTDQYAGLMAKPVPYLTSATAWFIVCKKKDTRFTWRRNVKFGSSDDFSTGNAVFKSTARWATWCYDWRGLYRNPGA